jgi:hypothetical protein
MKKTESLLLAIALLLIPFACKDKPAAELPREAYSSSTDGLLLKGSPDAKSEKVVLIPFGEKVILTPAAEKDRPPVQGTAKWYMTEWAGKKGWVQETSAGTMDSVYTEIKKTMTEQKASIAEASVKKFESSPFTITSKYSYPGGDMEPSNILFLSNGIMVVNSRIFTEKISNSFFEYEFLSEGKLLKIKFIDSRLNFNDYADMENNSRSVFKIDKNERSIIYQVKDNSFFFMNWGFVKK